MVFRQRDEEVQTFSPHSSDEAFAKSVGLRCFRKGSEDSEAEIFDRGAKALRIDVPVDNEKA